MTGSAFEAMDVVSRVPEAASERISRKIYSIINRGGSLRGERVVRRWTPPKGWRMTGSAFTAKDVVYRRGAKIG